MHRMCTYMQHAWRVHPHAACDACAAACSMPVMCTCMQHAHASYGRSERSRRAHAAIGEVACSEDAHGPSRTRWQARYLTARVARCWIDQFLMFVVAAQTIDKRVAAEGSEAIAYLICTTRAFCCRHCNRGLAAVRAQVYSAQRQVNR